VDGGATWSQPIPTLGGENDIDDICAAAADTVWGVLNLNTAGQIFLIHLNSDGAFTKQAFNPASGYRYEGVTCLDELTAWVVGIKGHAVAPGQPSGIILYTVDGGAHWATQPLPVAGAELWKVSFVGAPR